MKVEYLLYVVVLLASLCVCHRVQAEDAASVETNEGDGKPTPPDATTPDKDTEQPPQGSNQPQTPQTPDTRECTLASFKPQENFDKLKYEGNWYVISDNGLFPFQRTLDSLFYTAQDLKEFYSVTEEGFIIISAGRMFSSCTIGHGIAKMSDPSQPEKLDTIYKPTWLPWARLPASHWIMSTDYNYSLVFSCSHMLDDGTCHPSKAVVWTLNRKPEGHTEKQQELINNKLKEMCLDPSVLRNMPREKPCPEIDADNDYPWDKHTTDEL